MKTLLTALVLLCLALAPAAVSAAGRVPPQAPPLAVPPQAPPVVDEVPPDRTPRPAGEGWQWDERKKNWWRYVTPAGTAPVPESCPTGR